MMRRSVPIVARDWKDESVKNNDDDVISEVVAAAVHETWMQGRLKQGWKYGSERNDALKTNPCIIPYADLPESEKAYDRETARTVVRVLREQGYLIVRA